MARDRLTAAERWLGPLLRDASLATRRLVRAPVFVAVTAVTLTLGLGLFAVDRLPSAQSFLVGGAMGYRGDVPALCRAEHDGLRSFGGRA